MSDQPRKRRTRDRVSTLQAGIALIVASVLAVYLGFSKDVPFVNQPWEIEAAFRDSAGIRPNSPVRIAGVEVGKVTKVEHVGGGASAAMVTMSIEDQGRPLHSDATARIRPRIFLEGNFFVDLTAGTPNAGEMGEGDTIDAARTSTPVQFDEVLSALRDDVRGDLQTTVKELRTTEAEGGADAFNRSLEEQPDAYRFTAIVSEALLGKEPGDLGDWIRDQGTAFGALDADRAQLRNLITDFNATAGALADRSGSLQQAIGELPDTLGVGVPALQALDRSLPSVRAFAGAARPGIRSTGPTAQALLPLVRELRGLVRPGELRGLSQDLRAATPPLADVSRRSPALLEQLRLVAGCTNEVLVPFGNQTLPDPMFKANGPVHQELVQFLPGLAGESRSSDANGQYFKVLGAGGAETLNLGNGIFGSVAEPIVGVRPAAERTRPPLRGDVPCETQQAPDLAAVSGKAPTPVAGGATRAEVDQRVAKAQDVGVSVMRRMLRRKGSDQKVENTPASLGDIRRLAQRNGLTQQLDEALKRSAKP